MMVFGRTLFGGALAAGIITAAGVAACSASAVAYHETIREFSGTAAAQASAAGDTRRNAQGATAPVNASAQVVAVPQVFYTAFAIPAEATASTGGGPKADYFSGGTAEVLAEAHARASRRVRARQPIIYATAVAQGYGEIYVIPEPLPAKARATGVGSTYHLARGLSVAAASAEAYVQKFAGGAGHALSVAAADAEPWYTAGRRAAAEGFATGVADAVVLRNGVLHLDGNGSALATALVPPATTAVFQPQSLQATATAYATVVYQRGGKARATCAATAAGDALLSSTAASAGPGNVKATASGFCLYNARAAGAGAAAATAIADAQVIQTRAQAQTAIAAASATGWGNRDAGAVGTGVAGAVAATPAGLRIRRARGVAIAWAKAVAGALHFEATPRPAQCMAEGGAAARRTRMDGGEAVGTASGRGANQVNDIQRAPASRTVAVTVFARAVKVAAQPRTLAA